MTLLYYSISRLLLLFLFLTCLRDTAGQERFRTITHNYYRGAHGIALVYDISNEQSFLGITSWVQSVKAFADSSVTMVLIGNKSDLVNQRAVSTEAGQQLADEYGIPFFETSAKMDVCVHDAFNFLVQDVYTRLFGDGIEVDQRNNRSHNHIDLNNEKQKPTSNKPSCC